jgi:hypothetical protein
VFLDQPAQPDLLARPDHKDHKDHKEQLALRDPEGQQAAQDNKDPLVQLD